MGRAARAGVLYFVLAFMAGFLLGTFRELAVSPRFRPLTAVFIEVPIMLAFSIWAARFVVQRLLVPVRAGARLLMGSLAFLLLIMAETGVGVLLMDQTFVGHFAGYARPQQGIGLLAQIAFALFPLMVGPPRPALSQSR